MSKRADSSHRTSLRAFLDILVFIQLCHGQDECGAYVSPGAVVEEGTVCGVQDNPCPSIVDSISVLDNANQTGCTLKLLPGTYTGEYNLDITNDSPAWMRIEGVEGYAKTIFDCEYSETFAFKMSPKEVLMDYFISEITIKRCNGSGDGVYRGYGPIYSLGNNLVVTDCEFYDNTNFVDFANGGAINVEGADYVQISRCYFEGNYAENAGALSVVEVGEVLIEDCVFYKNQARIYADAIRIEDAFLLTMRNVNCTDHHGIEAVYTIQARKTKNIVWTDVIVDKSIQHAEQSWLFHCIWLSSPKTVIESSLYWNNVQVTNSDGAAEAVAAIRQYRDIRIVNCLFENNLADQAGAALQLLSDTEPEDAPWNILIEDTHFINNIARAGFGGALAIHQDDHVEGTLLIKGCTFTDNSAFQYGGGIEFATTGMIVDIMDSKFINNIALTAEGGAVFVGEVESGYTVLNVQHSEFANNLAVKGGSVFSNADGSVAFQENTFTGDHALEKGGSYTGDALATFDGDKFIGCSSDESGGAIYSHSGYLDMYSVKFVDCSAKFGGAIYIGPQAVLTGDTLTIDSCHAVGDTECTGIYGYGACVYFAEESCNNTLVSGTFKDNIADTSGAIFFLEEGGCFDLCEKDCEFENNVADYGTERGAYFDHVRVRDDPSTVVAIPGKEFIIQLNAYDVLGTHLAGRHVDIVATAGFGEAASRGVVIEGRNDALFFNGSAELSLKILVEEDIESTSQLKRKAVTEDTIIALHLDFAPIVERLTLQLEIGECGEYKKFVPDSENANGDVQLLTCGDIVEPSHGNQIGAWVVATILLIVLIVNAIMLRYYKHYSQIMHGNKSGLLFINIGLIIMEIGAICAASSELCTATVWLTLFGFSVASSFLIWKNAQVALLYHYIYGKQNLGVSRILRTGALFAGASSLMVIDFIILLLWTAIDSPFYILSEYQRVCVSDKTQTYGIALVVYKLLEMIGCFVIVYKLKQAPKMFREVTATLLVIPAVLLCFGIVIWASDSIIPSAEPILNSYIISIFVLFMFLIIFVEKWYLLHEGRYEELGETSRKFASSSVARSGSSCSVGSQSNQEELLGELKKLERESSKLNEKLKSISAKHRGAKEEFFYQQLFDGDDSTLKTNAGSSVAEIEMNAVGGDSKNEEHHDV